MEITVYSHRPGMCSDGGQIFKPAFDRPVRDTIERVIALVSHNQDIRIIASAVSNNGEVNVYHVRIYPRITLDAQYEFLYAKDFCLMEACIFNLKEVIHTLEAIFNDLSQS